MSSLPLPQFYAQTLRSLLPVLDDTLSLSLASTHDLLVTELDNLYLVNRMLSSLGVFSQNEIIDELADGEIVFLTVFWVLAEAEGRSGSQSGVEGRMAALKRSESAYSSYSSWLESYGVLSSDDGGENVRSAPADAGKRREMKIAQYRREKELKEKLHNILPGNPDTSSSPLEFILALLPSSSSPSTSASSTSVNPEQPETREAALLLLQYLHTLTLSSLSHLTMELDLLASAPASISEINPSHPNAPDRPHEEDNTWKLDRVPTSYKPRELISGGGKVLRPFTILPSTVQSSERERLRSEVFRDGHRLPTMSVDEYLEEERRRGNIITGGGQASYDAPTDSELLALEAENDGTALAEEKEEFKRIKEENWAQYAEENKRGAGNTMNRG
ncbi:immunoglobulin-binding protein 1, partial [Tremellales sp. Uapishka_1]